jgi:hypothetical protein
MHSKLSAASIRCFLFADVLADLFRLEPDRGHGVTTQRSNLIESHWSNQWLTLGTVTPRE